MGIDLLTNQRVAIKVQPVGSDACAREFAMMSALAGHPHPNVAHMLDYFCTESKGNKGKHELHTIQPLADTTLWHVYRSSQGALTDGRIAYYLRGVAAGLGHMHSLGIIHGDASLKNALVLRSDTVAVTDYGTAHSAMGFFLEDGDEVTTQYVRSPERLLGAHVSEPCIDVWAFGVQLWCLRTGDCDWIAVDCTLSQQLVAVAGAIGPIPAGCSLMTSRLWGTLSQRSLGAIEAASPTWPTWSSPALSLLRATMVWEPSARQNFSQVLGSAFLGFAGLGGTGSSGSVLQTPANATPVSLGTQAPGGEEAAGSTAAGAPAAGTPAAGGLVAAGTAAAGGHTAGSPTGQPLCHCFGGCGSRLHKRRANATYREKSGPPPVICGNATLTGERYCSRCKCELDGCGSCRKSSIRWCAKHHVTLSRGQYAVPSGVHTFVKDWPPNVKFLARLGHLLPFLEPGDGKAMRLFMLQHSVCQPRQPLCKRVVWAFLAHLIRWPPVVQEWGRRLASTAPSTAEALVADFCAMLRFSSGKGWPEMFRRMNGRSLGDAQSGLGVHAVRLGLIAPLKARICSKSTPARDALAAKAADGTGDSENTFFKLGRSQAVYEELGDRAPAIEVVENAIAQLTGTGLCFPAGPDDAEPFADGLLAAVLATRAFKSSDGRGWLKGGSDQEHAYTAKSFVRHILLAVEASCPGVFDDVPFQRFSRWFPDEAGHAAPLALLTGRQVRKLFGVSPLMWHCWACLIGGSDQPALANALVADTGVFWKEFLTFEADGCEEPEGSFPPGPQAMLAAVMA